MTLDPRPLSPSPSPFDELRATPLLVVLSGPSGVGKDAVLAQMKGRDGSRYFAVTATTRPRRRGEADGVDYLFLSEDTFRGMVKRGEFLEHAQVYGYRYGVPKEAVRSALAKGMDVVIKVDVQGAATIKRQVPQGIFIFLAPPSMEELEKRLRKRRTETDLDLQRRLATAEEEMSSLSLFDYAVVNQSGRPDWAVAQIDAIIMAEKCRVEPRRIQL